MKTATLTIKVPDDFEKGNPDKCFLSEFTLDGCFDICKITTGRCNKKYCPLEIQEKPLDLCKTCINIKFCGKRRRVGIVLACSDYKGE